MILSNIEEGIILALYNRELEEKNHQEPDLSNVPFKEKGEKLSKEIGHHVYELVRKEFIFPEGDWYSAISSSLKYENVAEGIKWSNIHPDPKAIKYLDDNDLI